jgi:hypothetical protein
MTEFLTRYYAKTLALWLSTCVFGLLTLLCLFGILHLTHVIGDDDHQPWDSDLGGVVLTAVWALVVVPKFALWLYQVLNRREPWIRICREGIEARLVGRTSLDEWHHLTTEWIRFYWATVTLQGFRTRQMRIGWPDFEGTQLSARPSVRVLILRGPFLEAGQEWLAGVQPAATYVRFNQEDFSISMDAIADAIARFQQDETERGALPSWFERS